METEFQIPFRSVRMGSLRSYPPRDARNCKLKFSRSEMKFKVVLHPKGFQEDAIKIVIPSSGIVLIEAYIMSGCPVIWVTTDVANARKVRRMTGMQLTTHPSPYFDPKSKELADQRLAIIPAEDPINQEQLTKFRTVVRIIAAERNVELEKFFVELTRVDCNEQLVRCTRYISQLTKFQSTFRMKQELVTETRSAVMDVKMEPESPKQAAIVISSDEDENLRKIHLKLKNEMKELARTSNSPAASRSTSSNDDLPTFTTSYKATVRRDVERPKRGASPDLFDFSDENPLELSQGKKQRIKDWITNEANVSSDQLDINDSQRKLGSQVEHKMKSDPRSTLKSPKRAKLNEDPDVNSSRSAQGHSSGGHEFAKNDAAVMGSKTELVTGPRSASGKTSDPLAGSVAKDPKTSNLPSSHIDLKSIRGTASLSVDMKNLHQDMESMLGATPLCVCVVKSQYVINLSANGDVKCMAVDNVDGRLTGCINAITEPVMMRPSKNVPVHGLCDEHRSRMLKHECCPGCGTFCAGGTFLVCNSTSQHQHRFHRNCLILTRHNTDCPHCGSAMSCIHEVTVDPSLDYTQRLAKKKKKTEMEGREKKFFPDCVTKIPGITKPFPPGVSYEEDVKLGPDQESLITMMLNLELDLPKKLRFQAKNLMQLVKQGDAAKVMQLLCGTRGDPNARTASNSRTALHEAVARGNIPIIHLLVTAGADVNVEDGDGKTPVFYAEEMKRLDILNYLIFCNANLNHKDCEGMVPLHHAAKHGRLETCLLLLKHGKESLNSVDEGGWTPLVWAAEHKQTNTAECLMYYEADVHAVDKEGNICLQWAALAGNKEILLMCLKKNCYIDHQNMHGDTALHIASRESNYDCVIILLGWGADPGIKNKEGRKPADCSPEYSLCWMSLMINTFIRNSISDHKGFVPFDRERILSQDMSRGREKLPISCVNAVDEAPCPANPPHEFLYVAGNIHKRTSVNSVLSIIKSCSCLDECTSCECGKMSGRCWYNGAGRLLPSFDYENPPDIYECNLICKCTKSCRNRVIQSGGVRYRLQIFRTRNMGWGVRALEIIPRGSYVCEFVGEVIADGDSKEDDCYLYDLDKTAGGTYCIDARFYGNVSRFINHHCEPNLVALRFFVDHQDADFPRIAFFAKREIHVGEQLGFDYGPGFWDEKCQHLTCECGAKKCKYSLQSYRRRRKHQEDIEMDEE